MAAIAGLADNVDILSVSATPSFVRGLLGGLLGGVLKRWRPAEYRRGRGGECTPSE
jgi:hypothetical protein